MEAQHLDPTIRLVWRVVSLGVLSIPAVVTAVVGAILVAAGALPVSIAFAPLGVTLVLAALVWWGVGVRYRLWTYRLGDDALELEHGVLFRTRSVIPYFRVQHVDTSQGPIERRLGLSNLTVHTASAATDAGLPGLAAAESERIRRFVLERAGAGDAV